MCAQTCAHVADAAGDDGLIDGVDVIVVALAGSPTRWLDRWSETVDTHRATFVVDESVDWIAGYPQERLQSASPTDTDVQVDAVASPGNLTDIGVTLTTLLEDHAERDRPTVLCFQSVTVLLQYSSLDEVYRFLHTLVGHVDGFGATSHFHLHADAHEEETVATLRPVFDRVRSDP